MSGDENDYLDRSAVDHLREFGFLVIEPDENGKPPSWFKEASEPFVSDPWPYMSEKLFDALQKATKEKEMTTHKQLSDFLALEAERIIEETGFEWVEIPGAIAWSAVLRLCYEPEKAGLTLQTTLLEIGQIMEIYNEHGEKT